MLRIHPTLALGLSIAFTALTLLSTSVLGATDGRGRVERASDDPPTLVTQPQSTAGLEGDSITLSVASAGTAPLQYQWFKDGQAIPGATASTFEILYLLEADAGTYRVEVSNAFGKVVSADAVISFMPLIQIYVEGALASGIVRVSKPVLVSLKSARPGWILHYTLDGSEPLATSPVYTNPFEVAENLELRIAVDSPDHQEFLEGDSLRFLFLAPQTLDWGTLPELQYLGRGQITVTATSGLPVRIRVFSGPATLEGSILTATGVGGVVLRAEQEGNETFASVTSERSLVIGRGIQQVTFPAIADQVMGSSPVQLDASASSQLAVAFELLSGPGVLSGSVITPTGPGRIEVKAVQAGNESWAPAEAVQTINVLPPATPTLRVLSAGATGTILLELRASAGTLGTIAFSPDLTAWIPMAGAKGAGLDQPVLVAVLIEPDSSNRCGFWRWVE